ncbi:hypothetical protein BH09MYX1_BH09MYX1_41530 [soil metagenome]
MNEAELDERMARLAAGDRSELEAVYRELFPRAVRAARRAANGSIVDDVAQEALLAVFERASEFTPGRPCLPWFYAIVANELRTSLRRDRRALTRDVSVDHPHAHALSTDEEPEMLLAERELRRAIDVARSSLDTTSAQAIAVMLGDAEMPDVPSATFRKRLSRAYARLRTILAGTGGIDV